MRRERVALHSTDRQHRRDTHRDAQQRAARHETAAVLQGQTRNTRQAAADHRQEKRPRSPAPAVCAQRAHNAHPTRHHHRTANDARLVLVAARHQAREQLEQELYAVECAHGQAVGHHFGPRRHHRRLRARGAQLTCFSKKGECFGRQDDQVSPAAAKTRRSSCGT